MSDPRESSRIPPHHVGAAAPLCALAVLVVGCGAPSGQFFILQNQAPTAGCVIPADKGAVYEGVGTLDVRVPYLGSANGYELFPLLENDMEPEGGDGVEPNRIILSGFEIDVTFMDGSPAAANFFATLAGDPSMVALLHYQVPWSGSVAPGGVTAASTVVFPAETTLLLRDGNVLADQSALVTANVRASGDTLHGHMTSDVFRYPLRICDGCLIHSITTCPATGTVLQGGICNAAQDAPVDCCAQGTDLICPATTTTP
jgi:hypothetical protein